MQVLKFGGSSLANTENMSSVTEIVGKAVDRDRTILVCSAIAGCTDSLIEIGRRASRRDRSYVDVAEKLRQRHLAIVDTFLPQEKRGEIGAFCNEVMDSVLRIAQGVYLVGELTPVSLDAIQGSGEIMSSRILSTKLSSKGISTRWVDATTIVHVRREIGKSIPLSEEIYRDVWNMVESSPIVSLFVVPGFIASDERNCIATLGRGGSDLTASLLAVGSHARRLEIWTDVSGMMTANPSIVPAARSIKNISYRAALELSHFGAKVIYPPTIQPVVSERIPIYVRNTFCPDDDGTLIEENPALCSERVLGISNSSSVALLSLEGSGMVGIPGFSSRLFDTLSRQEINIILITQASSVHTMCIAVAESDAEKARRASDATFAYEISLGKLRPLKVEKGFSIICLVGDETADQTGTTGRMLAALGRHSIPIRATAQGSSERNVSVVVRSEYEQDAVRYVHEEFFEQPREKTLNLFIAGFGTVGKTLVGMIAANGDRIAERTGKRLRVIGLSNSRKFCIDLHGLDLNSASELLDGGEDASSEAYFASLASISLPNSIFVDCTASSDISYKYINLFRRGYSVVACNKITFSAPYAQYRAVTEAALGCSATLRYETTVGAALPILESISRSVHSGDEILEIEAVLSGTMNYIFSTYRGGDGGTFAEVVRRAQDSGYTEPDPRLDLSGRDVLRKLLIMARVAGVGLDEEDVEQHPLLSREYFDGSVDDFYALLEKNEPMFAESYRESESRGMRQRFVARLRNVDGEFHASVSRENVGPDHPFHSLCGTDNSFMMRSRFYPQPLVVNGAGAGACQTASGVLNDILY